MLSAEKQPVAENLPWIKAAQQKLSSPLRLARTTCLSLVLTASLLCAVPSLAITLDDGDYSYMPDGTTLGLLYLQHVENRGLYSKGKKVSDDVKILPVHFYILSLNIYCLRFYFLHDRSLLYASIKTVLIEALSNSSEIFSPDT